MKKQKFPITQLHISNKVGRPIKSPIHVSNLEELHIDPELFIKTFSPFFEELPWDPYDARRLRVEFLKEKFPSDQEVIQNLFADYYTGKTKLSNFQKWIDQLLELDQIEFKKIKPWRKRSVAQFTIFKKRPKYYLSRQSVPPFVQKTDNKDFRSLQRIFQEAPDHHIENHLFGTFIIRIFQLVQKLRPECSATITVHFMSVQATKEKHGDNSPEGAHEDGADFIVSALVVNRKNIKGGETQILEKLANGTKQVVFQHTLQPGEFAFQADTGEELIYGNDLWHHVTPFTIDDPSKGEGWRNIIGLDIIING